MKDKLEFCRKCEHRKSNVIIDKGYLYPCEVCRFKCNYMKGMNNLVLGFDEIRETSIIQKRMEDIEFLVDETDKCEYYVENLIGIKSEEELEDIGSQ